MTFSTQLPEDLARLSRVRPDKRPVALQPAGVLAQKLLEPLVVGDLRLRLAQLQPERLQLARPLPQAVADKAGQKRLGDFCKYCRKNWAGKAERRS